MDIAVYLREFGRYGILYGGVTTAIITVVSQSERAIIAVFIAGLAIILLIGGLGDVRTSNMGTDGSPGSSAVVDTHIDVREGTIRERKILFYGLGLAVSGLSAMILSA
jgi:hypothetical protein